MNGKDLTQGSILGNIMTFIIAYNIIASIFRGLGDSKSPMYFVAVACVVNIVLDYLFIGFLGLGAMGAALGTTLSQMASVLFAITAIRHHRGVMDISRSDLLPQKYVIKSILKIVVPIAIQDGFIQISFLVITVIANQRGLIDAAAVGIVEKFIGLVFIVPSAMLSTVSAISAQNIGAGNMKRAKRTMYGIASLLVCTSASAVSSPLAVIPSSPSCTTLSQLSSPVFRWHGSRQIYTQIRFTLWD